MEQECTSGYQQSCTTQMQTVMQTSYQQKCSLEPTQVCSTVMEPVEVPRQVCRSVPQQECRQMPGQLCQQVQQGGECRQVEREVCQPVTSQKCQDVPRQQCLVVPVEKCVPGTSRRCSSQPRQQCRKVPNKVCQEVPRQVCKAVPKKSCQQVPRKQCQTGQEEKCVPVSREVCDTVTEEECKVNKCHGSSGAQHWALQAETSRDIKSLDTQSDALQAALMHQCRPMNQYIDSGFTSPQMECLSMDGGKKSKVECAIYMASTTRHSRARPVPAPRPYVSPGITRAHGSQLTDHSPAPWTSQCPIQPQVSAPGFGPRGLRYTGSTAGKNGTMTESVSAVTEFDESVAAVTESVAAVTESLATVTENMTASQRMPARNKVASSLGQQGPSSLGQQGLSLPYEYTVRDYGITDGLRTDYGRCSTTGLAPAPSAPPPLPLRTPPPSPGSAAATTEHTYVVTCPIRRAPRGPRCPLTAGGDDAVCGSSGQRIDFTGQWVQRPQ